MGWGLFYINSKNTILIPIAPHICNYLWWIKLYHNYFGRPIYHKNKDGSWVITIYIRTKEVYSCLEVTKTSSVGSEKYT